MNEDTAGSVRGYAEHSEIRCRVGAKHERLLDGSASCICPPVHSLTEKIMELSGGGGWPGRRWPKVTPPHFRCKTDLEIGRRVESG